MDLNVKSLWESTAPRDRRGFAVACLGFLLLCTVIFFFSYPQNFAPSVEFQDNWMELRDKAIQSISRSSNFSTEELWNLDGILRNATASHNTVILTPLNQAWAAPGSMLDLLFQSFRSGENTSEFLSSLLIVALDQRAFERCIALHPHCFQLRTKGVDFSGEKRFMSEDYLRMTRTKISFLAVVLELGYNFVFTDGDLLWFRDPFPFFSAEADFEVSCDRFLGDESNIDNFPNTGFLHVRSSNRTVELLKLWHRSTEIYAGSHDQEVFNTIKHGKEFRETGARIRFLPTRYFSSFCERPDDLETFRTMHANCCVGMQAKLDDLRLVLDDWKRFKEQGLNETLGVRFRAPDACRRSW